MKTPVVYCLPLLLILPVLVINLSSCQEKTHAEKTNTADRLPPVVQVQPVLDRSFGNSIELSGTIEADKLTTLGFAVGGRVKRVLAGEGQAVRSGQLLARISPVEYEQNLALANAGLERALDMYQRLETLYRAQSLPQKDFVEAKVTLAQAKIGRDQALERLANTNLYAPFAGVIAQKSVEVGMNKAPGEAAFTLVKIDRVMAQVAVPEPQIGFISRGQKATVLVAATGKTYTGTVQGIGPVADAVAKTYPVKIAVSNSAQTLLPGMLATVHIQTGQKTTALTIQPQALIRGTDEKAYVYVADRQTRKVVRRPVVVGTLSGKTVTIQQGLTAGEAVVVGGQYQLKDGQLVRFAN